ncbi:MAG: peptidoglycan editing factor PgeF [Clostridia bacterium]|nr:peptidoglycan editing factor PgeF [Clostridia bacterium]
MMIENRDGQGVCYLTFSKWSEWQDQVRHGFSTRIGGVSSGIYESMNLSYSRGDDDQCVTENLKRMTAALNVSAEKIVCMSQEHTANVIEVTGKDCLQGEKEPRIKGFDGMITNEPSIVLMTFHADCTPLFFYDTKNHAIGLTHSGWRGTAKKIGAVTVKMMQERYGTRPEDVMAGIGPSICKACYEVSEDVIKEFAKSFSKEEMEQIITAHENQDGKYQLDLWKANELILLEAGVKPEHLDVTDLCTCCKPDFLFSHRASNGKRGSLAAFLSLL